MHRSMSMYRWSISGVRISTLNVHFSIDTTKNEVSNATGEYIASSKAVTDVCVSSYPTAAKLKYPRRVLTLTLCDPLLKFHPRPS